MNVLIYFINVSFNILAIAINIQTEYNPANCSIGVR